MKKTHKYAISIVGLLIANLFLFFGGRQSASNDLDSSYFDFSDGQVVSIRIENRLDTVLLNREDQDWQLNGTYAADPGFVNTLLSVLDRLEKRRKLKNWTQEVEGSITLEWENGTTQEVTYAVNPNRTKTYFIGEGEVSQVTVPGYRDNVADLFELHSDQWRDRLLVDGSWRTIQKVTIVQEEQYTEIRFADDFFLVNDVSPVDSAAVIDYLNQFQFFQANEMVSQGRFDVLDSLSKQEVFAEITIDDIKQELPFSFRIFPKVSGQNYHLVIDSEGRWMVIDAPRIQQLLAIPR